MSNSVRRLIRLALLFAALATIACGQKGALYLPQAESEIITRPTQTPAATQSPDATTETPSPDATTPDEPPRPQ